MKKKLLYVLLLVTSCTSAPKIENASDLHDVNVDFATADTIVLTSRTMLQILPEIHSFMVKDSVLFAFEESPENFGHCYNINNGNELSVLLGRGNAGNEMLSISYPNSRMHKDSLQFINTDIGTIKTFSVNDIITKPINERDYSTANINNAIGSLNFIKTDNNKIIGSIVGGKIETNEAYFSYDGTNVTLFGEINKEMFQFDGGSEYMLRKVRMLIDPRFTTYDNKVVAVDKTGILLKVIDVVDKDTIVAERNYNKIIYDFWKSTNGLNSRMIRCNDEKIYCFVTENFKTKKEDIELDMYNCFILTFDWKLNPIKKYYIGAFDSKNSRYYLSEDGKMIYLMTMNGESQELFTAKIE